MKRTGEYLSPVLPQVLSGERKFESPEKLAKFARVRAFSDLNTARIVECFGLYLDGGGAPISRAQAEQRMFAKLAAPRFMGDIRPLLAPEEKLTDDIVRKPFVTVFERLITILPGEPWAKTPKMKEKFGMD